MKRILTETKGELTGRPYRVIRDQYGIGIDMLCDDGTWDESCEVFETVQAALKFIADVDRAGHLEMMERRFNVQ